MAQPPAGYSLQRGAYFTADGEGPYAWDGASMRLIGENTSSPMTEIPFVGASTQLLWLGRGVLMQFEVTSSAGGGSIKVEDALSAGAGTDLGTTAITAGTTPTVSFNGGLGTGIYQAVLLTVTGTITGFIQMKGVL